MLDLSGKTAIVTGAAHGFGRAISLTLGRCGAVVWAVDQLADELAETVELARQAGVHCTAAGCDVTDSSAVQALVDRALSADGRVDILINNAGGVCGQVGRPVEEVADDDWDVVVRTNLYGAFYCIRAATPAMKQQRFGRIVNISSGAGRSFSLTGIQSYASAKAGQIGLTRQMAKELGHGILPSITSPLALCAPTQRPSGSGRRWAKMASAAWSKGWRSSGLARPRISPMACCSSSRIWPAGSPGKP